MRRSEANNTNIEFKTAEQLALRFFTFDKKTLEEKRKLCYTEFKFDETEKTKMKKVTALLLALVMCFSLAACGGSSSNAEGKIADYVAENKADLIEQFESGFTGSGLTCETEIKAVGTGFVIDVTLNELPEATAEIKETLQSTYDGMSATFEEALETMQKELPEISYYTVNVRAKNGDIAAVVTAGKK